jgi:thiamine biosynthesis lipoprotein
MGMPITVELVDAVATECMIDEVFAFLDYVDNKFSTYKEDSEISRINRKEIARNDYSEDMRTVLALAQETKEETNGYFDIMRGGNGSAICDPSGIVKGWAIQNAAELLREKGLQNFYVDAGGDIEVAGKNERGQDWRVGIRNPSNLREIVKVLSVTNCGVATSGTYVRGQHIYSNRNNGRPIDNIVSLTVVGPNVYEADRFATAAFAMGRDGIHFIESLEGFEGYMIDWKNQATLTSGLHRYITND